MGHLSLVIYQQIKQSPLTSWRLPSNWEKCNTINNKCTKYMDLICPSLNDIKKWGRRMKSGGEGLSQNWGKGGYASRLGGGDRLGCACVVSRFSHVWLFTITWTIACQAPLSTGFSRQGYWSGLPFPPPGDLLDPGIEPTSLMSPTLAGGFFTSSTTW